MSGAPRSLGAALASLAAVMVVGGPLAAPAAAGAAAPGQDERAAQALLVRAMHAARTVPHRGEVLWVVREGATARTLQVTVSGGRGRVVLEEPGTRTLWLTGNGGGLLDYRDASLVPLPPVPSPGTGTRLQALGEKYGVRLDGTELVYDRPTTRIAVVRTEDGALCERLWVDEASGLLVRRETHVPGEQDPVRLAAFLTLDLSPPGAPAAPLRLASVDSEVAEHDVTPLDDDKASAMAEAGWTVIDELADGYRPAGRFVVSQGPGPHAASGGALQQVFSDGLYSVSVFEQRGVADWASLPPGAEPAEGLGWRAYEWPGAIPHRLVWAADGSTFTLVGDAPPSQLRALASSLPHADAPSSLERVGRGLRRLWSWVSPWE